MACHQLISVAALAEAAVKDAASAAEIAVMVFMFLSLAINWMRPFTGSRLLD
jgi:hypothetical protein